MSNPASTVALAERWRPLSTQEETNASVFLDDAWRMIRRQVDGLEAAMVTDADLADEVVRVICTAVLRVMKNPDGARQESIDDYSWTRDQAVSAGLLYFTDAELASLFPGTLVKGRAYMIDPFAGRDWTDWS